MERDVRDAEQITPEVTRTGTGLDVAAARRYTWHFANSQEAIKYFRRRHIQFTALHWGLRVLVASGVLNVVRSVDQTLQSHDFLTGAGAVVVAGLSLVVEGLNERNVGERVRLHQAVMRRFSIPEE